MTQLSNFRRCPYCGEVVTRGRRYHARVPPDERNEYTPPMVRMESEDDLTQEMTFQVIDAIELLSCGHRFRRDDVQAYASGEIRLRELGPRVLNPRGRTT